MTNNILSTTECYSYDKCFNMCQKKIKAIQHGSYDDCENRIMKNNIFHQDARKELVEIEKIKCKSQVNGLIQQYASKLNACLIKLL